MSNKIMLMLYGNMGCGKSYFAEKFKQYLEDSYLSNEYDILIESSSKFIKKDFDNGTLFNDPIAKKSSMIKSYKISYETAISSQLKSLYKRILLQTCGTEIPILHGTETNWAEMLCEDINKQYQEDDKVIVINDGCRFLHEINTFTTYGFKVLTIYMVVDDSTIIEAYHERYGDSKIANLLRDRIINHYSDIYINAVIPEPEMNLVINGRCGDNENSLVRVYKLLEDNL